MGNLKQFDETQASSPTADNHILEAFLEHVKLNWQASLGYGEDEGIYKYAAEEYDWLLDAMGITIEDFVSYALTEEISSLPKTQKSPKT